MITLLSRLFIPDRNNLTDNHVRQSYGILCGAVGIFLNLCLFTGKLFAGTISHSIAITADAFNNLSDAASSVITMLGFRLAGQKPDSDHPFGHGRLEYISGLLVSVIILLMGFELLKSSVLKICYPEELLFSPVLLVILLLSILVKCYMFLYNRRLGKRINSAAMDATAVDSLSDVLATSVVLISTLLSHYLNLTVDGWAGLVVGIFICSAGFSTAKDTISLLLGQAPDKGFVEEIEKTVTAHKGILGVHDLIVHNYGPGRILISLHAEVPAEGDILVMHDLIDQIEHELNQKMNCHAVIHMDPVQIHDEETARLKTLVKGYLEEISPVLTMHDFRRVPGPTHTNLIFDVVAPYDFTLSDEELIQKITERIQKDYPDYHAVIEVDKQMV